ncbi:oxidoreductase [Gordonia sp. SID5947]|uniref:flavin reductase family protein n=1 Tax=Gordonia sp. SID5947 TaxID=2690315 RepID=UPI00136A8984|nr:flavin reductase family protein [Gordonia sp. SID5947]MYR08557.1 oxidoreductase [Gordonia sp. SID5947]
MGDDQSGFDEMVDAIDYPMFVVTAHADGRRAGCLVGFASQTSIDPRRFLVGISKRNQTHDIAEQAEYLAVHLLPRERTDIAALFGAHSGYDTDKFTRCAWSEGPHGLPILDDAAFWFVGKTVRRFDAGDHDAFLLDPVDSGSRVSAPGAQSWVTFSDVHDLDAGRDA